MNFEETPPKIRSWSPGIGLLFCRSCLKLKFVMDIDRPGELPKRSYECRTYSVKFTSANSNVPGLAHVRSEGSCFSSPPSRARPGTSETERERGHPLASTTVHRRAAAASARPGEDQIRVPDQIRSDQSLFAHELQEPEPVRPVACVCFARGPQAENGGAAVRRFPLTRE